MLKEDAGGKRDLEIRRDTYKTRSRTSSSSSEIRRDTEDRNKNRPREGTVINHCIRLQKSTPIPPSENGDGQQWARASARVSESPRPVAWVALARAHPYQHEHFLVMPFQHVLDQPVLLGMPPPLSLPSCTYRDEPNHCAQPHLPCYAQHLCTQHSTHGLNREHAAPTRQCVCARGTANVRALQNAAPTRECVCARGYWECARAHFRVERLHSGCAVA